VTRAFRIVTGAGLALSLVLAGIALRAFVLQGSSPARPAPQAEAKRTNERAPVVSRRAQPLSVPSLPKAIPADAVPEFWGPASIVETLETSRDPRAIQAALRAVLSTYSSRSTRKPMPGPELEQALARHVRSDTGAIARAALAAARVPLMSEAPATELVTAIAGAAAPEVAPARRTLALRALDLIRPDRRTAPVLAALEQALSASQPEVVSQALFALANSGPSLSPEHRVRLGERVLELAGHPNPGVRGRALFVLAEIADLVTPEPRLAAALRSLGDREPYVRAEAAALAGRCGAPQAIHALMPHIADLAAANYDLAFTDIEGRSSIAEHRVPGRPSVAEAALFSILALSRAVPVARQLALTLGGGVQPQARVLENVANVRRWYGEVAAQIPR
jgi:hypothetical protein